MKRALVFHRGLVVFFSLIVRVGQVAPSNSVDQQFLREEGKTDFLNEDVRKVVQNPEAETSQLLPTEPGQPQGATQNLTEIQLEYCSHARGKTVSEIINPAKRNLLN